MFLSQQLQRQSAGYRRYHAARTNLLLHIVAVPAFLLANLGLLVSLLRLSWPLALACAVTMGIAMAIQGQGHGQEQHPAEAFTGVGDALSRIFLEQWVTFPRFVLSGGWGKAFRLAKP